MKYGGTSRPLPCRPKKLVDSILLHSLSYKYVLPARLTVNAAQGDIASSREVTFVRLGVVHEDTSTGSARDVSAGEVAALFSPALVVRATCVSGVVDREEPVVEAAEGVAVLVTTTTTSTTTTVTAVATAINCESRRVGREYEGEGGEGNIRLRRGALDWNL